MANSIDGLHSTENLAWTCPQCGSVFYAVGEFRFCPECADRKQRAQDEYWNKRKEAQRVVASEILAKYITTK